MRPPLPASLDGADISDQIISYVFNDGVQTLTESNSGLAIAWVDTDGNGDIVQWSFNAIRGLNSVVTLNSSVNQIPIAFDQVVGDLLSAAEVGRSGTWTRVF